MPFVRSGFCQGVARDSVLSFASSVRCGHRPYTESFDSLGALANGSRRRAPTADGVRHVRDVDGVRDLETTADRYRRRIASHLAWPRATSRSTHGNGCSAPVRHRSSVSGRLTWQARPTGTSWTPIRHGCRCEPQTTPSRGRNHMRKLLATIAATVALVGVATASTRSSANAARTSATTRAQFATTTTPTCTEQAPRVRNSGSPGGSVGRSVDGRVRPIRGCSRRLRKSRRAGVVAAFAPARRTVSRRSRFAQQVGLARFDGQVGCVDMPPGGGRCGGCCFVAGGAEVAEGAVEAAGVVPAFDVVEDGAAEPGAGGPRAGVDQLAFDGREERLGHGVVPAFTGPCGRPTARRRWSWARRA